MSDTKTEKLLASSDKLRNRAIERMARARERERKTAVRAKIIAGAVLLDDPKAFGLTPERVRAALDLAVTREHDRTALGLPPRSPEKATHPAQPDARSAGDA